MYYVLLIHADEAEVASAKPGEIESLMKDVDRFDVELTQAGQNLGSIRLRSSIESRILSVREGKRRMTDGPFAETKEQLGGLYIIEAESMKSAIAIAERLPASRFGSVEVREALGLDLHRKIQAW